MTAVGLSGGTEPALSSKAEAAPNSANQVVYQTVELDSGAA
jgi:hypothetical protein